MKRSEMVKALQEWIKRCDYPCSAWEFVEQADGIISFLESQRMQPPVYEKKTEIRMMPHNQVWTSSKPVNEWENEE